jgi:transcriptional regulator with GAF, ATPase, and Fis domain
MREREADQSGRRSLPCVQPDRAAMRRFADADDLERIEKEAIIEALEKTHFNRTAAARLLGITFRALRYRMERLGIKEELDSKS